MHAIHVFTYRPYKYACMNEFKQRIWRTSKKRRSYPSTIDPDTLGPAISASMFVCIALFLYTALTVAFFLLFKNTKIFKDLFTQLNVLISVLLSVLMHWMCSLAYKKLSIYKAECDLQEDLTNWFILSPLEDVGLQ